jgi:predicted DNA-binding ribbon-helix-helix protein
MSQPEYPTQSAIHRTVQADGQRFSIKLEAAYWSVLKDEAARDALPLAQLIKRIARQVPTDATLTGVLRLYCLEVLRARVPSGTPPPDAVHAGQPLQSGIPTSPAGTTVAAGPDTRPIHRLFTFFMTCPAAGLLLNATQKVVCVNRAFEEWSRLRSEHILGKPIDWYFQIRLPEPVETVLARFAGGASESLVARVSYIRPGRIVVARAKVSLLHWTGPADFIWSVMIAPPSQRHAASPLTAAVSPPKDPAKG